MSYTDNPGNRLVGQTVRLGRHDRDGEFETQREVQEFRQGEYLCRIDGVQNIGRLLLAAERARTEADSWRDFRVGAAAMVCYFNPAEHTWRYELVQGANSKPTESGEINVHAEHTIMTKAREFALPGEVYTVPFVVLIGDMQADQQTGIHSPTLHPCGVCRQAFKEPDTPIGPTTMFLSATADMTQFEWYTAAALDDFHNHGNSAGMGGVGFSKPPLALTYDPESIVVDGAARLSLLESEEFINSDNEVSLKLIMPALMYAASIE